MLRFFFALLFPSLFFTAAIAAPSTYTPCTSCTESADTSTLANTTLRLYTNGTLDEYVTVLVKDARYLLDSMNPSRPTILYISGWTETPDSVSVATVLGACLERDDYNIILADYTLISGRDYIYAFLSVNGVGYTLATALNQLVAYGLDPSTLRIIAHSLGAQISSHIAKYTDFKIPRITALDPAGPGFYEVIDNLSSGDAEFVDIIHTNTDLYGSGLSVGSVNFYPNGGVSVQPGCPVDRVPMSTEDFCSHHKSWWYFAESVRNPDSFIGVECDSYDSFKLGSCASNMEVLMGFDTPINSSGNFYLQTNSEAPFGRGETGVYYQEPAAN